MRLSQCRSTKQVLATLSHRAWFRSHGVDCPPEKLCDEVELIAVLTHGRAAAAETNRLLTQVLPPPRVVVAGAEAGWRCVGKGASLLAIPMDPRAASPQTVLQITRAHLALPREKRPTQHPLEPLVETCQAWPTEVNYNDRPGILPSRLAVIDPSDKRSHAVFSPAMHQAQDGELRLGFSETASDAYGPVLPSNLFGLEERRRGPGAATSLRMFVLAMSSIDIGDWCIPGTLTFSITLRQLLQELYPSNRLVGSSWVKVRRRTPRRSEYIGVLSRAMDRLNSSDAMIPYVDPVTGRTGKILAVSMFDLPDRLDEPVRFNVNVPPGAKAGPALPPSLPWWGRIDAAAYRALINIGFMLHYPGKTLRPVRAGKRTHWAWSKEPESYELLSDNRLIEICYPLSARKHRRNLIRDSQLLLRKLEKAGEIRLEDNGRRILRPVAPPTSPVVRS